MRLEDIKPCGHYVLIEPDPVEETTASGIIIHVDEKEIGRELAATTTGTLVAYGNQSWKAFDDGEPWAEVGDHVFYTKHVSKILDVGDKKYFLMTDDNVLCVINDSEE